jgi:hypothetical protein
LNCRKEELAIAEADLQIFQLKVASEGDDWKTWHDFETYKRKTSATSALKVSKGKYLFVFCLPNQLTSPQT